MKTASDPKPIGDAEGRDRQMWVLEEVHPANKPEPYADGTGYAPQAFSTPRKGGPYRRKSGKKSDAPRPRYHGQVYPPHVMNSGAASIGTRHELHLPQWMEFAAKWTTITPERFKEMRWQVHQMTVEQCAAFLRVDATSIWRWESGKTSIPYAAYMALRLLSDVRFLPHQVAAWKGWKIISAGPDVGMLYDAEKSGEMFSPSELRATRWVKGERDGWRKRAEKAEGRAADLEAENTRLRKLFQEQGVTRELRDMHLRIGALLGGVGTADLLELNTTATAIRAKEKAA